MPTAVTGPDAMTFDAPGFGMATALHEDGRVVPRVAGEPDVATAPRLDQALVGIVGRGSGPVLDVDPSEPRVADATGPGVLGRARPRLGADGGELRLCSPSAHAARVLDIRRIAPALARCSVSR